MSESVSRPQPLGTDASFAFAHNTMRGRVPAILREVLTLNPDYDAGIRSALERLHDDVASGAAIPTLDLPAPDYAAWAAEYAPHTGQTWHGDNGANWFFCETYVYRLLMQAVRWWETERDPFAPKKADELASPALWHNIDQAQALVSLPRAERLSGLILNALWGNRIDLSYAASIAHGSHWTNDDLLVADHEAAVAHLARTSGDVHFINDNTGTELAADLALADALLDDPARRVFLHLKVHPTFVSDATVYDTRHMIDVMASGAHGNDAQRLGARLQAAFAAGRLRLASDPFWNSSRFLWDLPPHLSATFAGAALVVVKGDANYRRAVGDALWSPDTPLSEVVGGFTSPLLLLRTMKSDPVVGLPAGMAAQLDAMDAKWRFNGRRGVIQFPPQPE